MAAEPVITEVPDPIERWPELEPLYRGLHQHHEPLRGFVLTEGWQSAQQAILATDADSIVLVAWVGGRAIALLDGLIRIHPITGVLSGYINSVYVEPPWRRQGVTARMVEHFERWATEHGATELMLGVDAANEEGVAAWEHLGFEPESYRMRRPLD